MQIGKNVVFLDNNVVTLVPLPTLLLSTSNNTRILTTLRTATKSDSTFFNSHISLR